jgi:hypothetical protein
MKASGSSSTEMVPTEHWVTNQGGEHEVDAVKCDGGHGTWCYEIVADLLEVLGGTSPGILIVPQAGVL